MAGLYDDIDIRFYWNGDFGLGHDGDFADTLEDGLLSLRQELHDICASALGDWELYPNRGAGLEDYIGEPNTRSVSESIHDRVRMAIIAAALVAEDDLEVRVVPVHRHKVLILLSVHVMPSAFNKMNAESSYLKTALLFDFVEQGMLFFDKIPELTNI